MLNNNHGMTMLEVEIAMITMACILTSSFVFVTNSLESKTNLQRVATANQIGTDVLEEIRTMKYSDLIPDSTMKATTVDAFYKCSWIVGDSSYYKTVDVTVSWPKDKPEHSIELSTIVSNK